MKQVKIGNVAIDNISMGKFLEELQEGVIFTPNVDHLMMLQSNKAFYGVYQKADYRVCDSKLLQMASKFLGTPIAEKISGSDLFPAFYHYHKDNTEIKIFLLGAMDGVAQKAAEKINKKLDREIIGTRISLPLMDLKRMKKSVKRSSHRSIIQEATVLAVGVSAPKQEKWIMKVQRPVTPM